MPDVIPQLLPVPHDLQPWLEAAVVVKAPATLAQSHFPAMISSMLVVRLQGLVLCRGETVPPSVWISASTVPADYQHSGEVHAVGLVLRPEASGALFANARGRINTMCPLSGLVGPRWSQVEQEVLTATEDQARLGVLFHFVRQEIAPPSSCETRRQQTLALLQAAALTGAPSDPPLPWSQRQLERHFAKLWGMSPKQFALIARLNNALGDALAEPDGSVADLAMEHGYFDQSHLGRDVRRLAGHPLPAMKQSTQNAHTTLWPLQAGRHILQSPKPQALEPPPARKR